MKYFVDDRLKEKIKYIRKQEVLQVREKGEFIHIWYIDKNSGESIVLQIIYSKEIFSWVSMRLKPVISANFGRMVEANKKEKKIEEIT